MIKRLNARIIHILTLLFIFFAISTGNIAICRITVMLLLVLCVIYSLKEDIFVNPLLLFSLTPLSLLLYINLGHLYMTDLKSNTWIIAIINIYAFIMAYKVTTSKINKASTTDKDIRLEIKAIIFYLISLSSYIIPDLSSITWMFAIAAVVCALKTKKKRMYLFVIVIFLISALGVTSKTTMLSYCMAFIISYEKFFASDELKRKRMKWILCLGVIFMIFTFSFANKDRGSYDAEESVGLYEAQGMTWEFSDILFMPYMYLTNGWTNLQYVMDTQDTRTYGLWTIKPVLSYLQVDEYFSKEYKMNYYSSFNTCAYMTYGFKDYGYWLSIIMSIFLGFFVKKVYLLYKYSNNVYDVVSYALVSQAVLEMFFSNHFFAVSYPFTIVILMTIVKFILK